MEILVGKTAGFCYGVKRAVEGAVLESRKAHICCLGDIAHNKQVVQNLENLGIKCIDTIEEANENILIRAHGAPREIYETARKKNIKIQDYTCPNVLRVHKIAEKYKEKGYFIFLLGEKNHPENIGTISHCGKDYYIFEKEEEFEVAMQAFQKTNKKKLLVILQTTYSLQRFQKIEQLLEDKLQKDVKLLVKNTICKATELRQRETEEISKKVDMMIIIGGKNSFNTKKIYEIAKKNCKNTVLIENVQELETEESPIKVGIMAGASTPKENIDEVIEFLKRRSL